MKISSVAMAGFKNIIIKHPVLTIIALLLALQTEAYTKLINQLKPGFYFEKYDTAVEAEQVLLKLYPIGSNVDDLLRMYEKLGRGSCDIYSNNGSKIVNELINPFSDFLGCGSYRISTNVICITKWSLRVYVDPDNHKRIAKVEAFKRYYCFK
jgi:hypothetical protein